ncbi:type I-C CRISPR-associated protein Cas8c/Csd1 [Lachnobacterium bovis]|uniref:CRISPR-associated protein Csd1 n=1 Tax=Lachnobacterium bovis DSM 14045 TaxID=1122142 RepID=A0A1H3MPI7_9FIRM|nr:type I-C CRISPR-associated protein Cas8c/Csd1 [Lachnobacterium bovis]SDY78571.1 CRISPR-associated protein Csd1 [Lachnobacterium bovis DSM 14045]
MGLLQQAMVTYDFLKSVSEKNEEEPLCPIAHIITKADIEVKIDIDGNYIGASEEKAKVIIPVTEKSSGRTSKPNPHALCDQIKYLVSYDKKSTEAKELYMNQLKEWIESDYSDNKIVAIYNYVKKNSLLVDLKKDELLKMKSDKSIDEKIMIVWNVIGSEGKTQVYYDTRLMEKYTKFYLDKVKKNNEDICYVTGKKEPLASQHLKGIFSLNGNAKLISANDTTNFTFKGRFLEQEQAIGISYTASQKAHNALKWLITNQGVIIGGRCFLGWSPEGEIIPKCMDPFMAAMYDNSENPEIVKLSDYRDELLKAVLSYKSNLKNKVNSKVVIAVFDAATTGRLALVNYNEILIDDYLEKLRKWDEYCSWYGYKSTNIESPSILMITKYAFGVERDKSGKGKVEISDGISKQTVDRLLQCRLNEELFPRDIKNNIVNNASKLYLYGTNTRRKLLNITCAVIRKFHYDYMKEDFAMELEQERKDISYQFGRLLAVYEKIEKDALGSNEENQRETNAMRMQSVYCKKPMHYANELEKQMQRAYFTRLNPGKVVYYKKMIGQILSEINNFPESEWNKSLKDSYLMGYYLQRRSLYTKKDNENMEK